MLGLTARNAFANRLHIKGVCLWKELVFADPSLSHFSSGSLVLHLPLLFTTEWSRCPFSQDLKVPWAVNHRRSVVWNFFVPASSVFEMNSLWTQALTPSSSRFPQLVQRRILSHLVPILSSSGGLRPYTRHYRTLRDKPEHCSLTPSVARCTCIFLGPTIVWRCAADWDGCWPQLSGHDQVYQTARNSTFLGGFSNVMLWMLKLTPMVQVWELWLVCQQELSGIFSLWQVPFNLRGEPSKEGGEEQDVHNDELWTKRVIAVSLDSFGIGRSIRRGIVTLGDVLTYTDADGLVLNRQVQTLVFPIFSHHCGSLDRMWQLFLPSDLMFLCPLNIISQVRWMLVDSARFCHTYGNKDGNVPNMCWRQDRWRFMHMSSAWLLHGSPVVKHVYKCTVPISCLS